MTLPRWIGRQQGGNRLVAENPCRPSIDPKAQGGEEESLRKEESLRNWTLR